MAEVDTSSYPRPAAPVSPLDTAAKLGAMQSQKLDIDQKKLSQANEALTYLTRGLNSLGPNASKDDLINLGHGLVKDGLAPPSMMQNMEAEIRGTPDAKMPQFIDSLRTRTAQHQEMINHFIGQPSAVNTGQRTDILRLPGSPNQPSRLQTTIPNEIPPTQPVIGRDNQPTLQGNQPRPPNFNERFDAAFPNRLRTAPMPAGPVNPSIVPGMRPGERATKAEVLPAQTGGPTGPATGVPPDYDPGLKQFAADQDMATQKLTAIKPALQALPLAKELTTGIGTETYNKVLAAAHNLGLLPESMSNKVAVYQELSKKLAQYVQSSPIGQRSDAAQTLAEASSPSPKAQINPALIKLTQDAIALDRVQAIRSMAFTNDNGSPRRDYHNYGQHRSQFPARIDERALTLDMMTPEKRNTLLNEMEKKQKTPEGKKFKYTLELADRIGIFDLNR